MKNIKETMIDIFLYAGFYLGSEKITKMLWKRGFTDFYNGNRETLENVIEHYRSGGNQGKVPRYAYQKLIKTMRDSNLKKPYVDVFIDKMIDNQDIIWFLYRHHMKGKPWIKKTYYKIISNSRWNNHKDQLSAYKISIIYQDLKQRFISDEINHFEYFTIIQKLIINSNISNLTLSQIKHYDLIVNQYPTLIDLIESQPNYSSDCLPLAIDFLS